MQKSTDVTQLFGIAAASIFGAPVADLVGAYLLIIFAASAGAGWSLSRSESRGKSGALFYFVRIGMTAVILTASLAEITTYFMTSIDARHFIAPVAFCIGLIGDDWSKVARWVVGALRDFLNRIGG